MLRVVATAETMMASKKKVSALNTRDLKVMDNYMRCLPVCHRGSKTEHKEYLHKFVLSLRNFFCRCVAKAQPCKIKNCIKLS
jgi:hypothetical protein